MIRAGLSLGAISAVGGAVYGLPLPGCSFADRTWAVLLASVVLPQCCQQGLFNSGTSLISNYFILRSA